MSSATQGRPESASFSDIARSVSFCASATMVEAFRKRPSPASLSVSVSGYMGCVRVYDSSVANVRGTTLLAVVPLTSHVRADPELRERTVSPPLARKPMEPVVT